MERDPYGRPPNQLVFPRRAGVPEIKDSTESGVGTIRSEFVRQIGRSVSDGEQVTIPDLLARRHCITGPSARALPGWMTSSGIGPNPCGDRLSVQAAADPRGLIPNAPKRGHVGPPSGLSQGRRIRYPPVGASPIPAFRRNEHTGRCAQHQPSSTASNFTPPAVGKLLRHSGRNPRVSLATPLRQVFASSTASLVRAAHFLLAAANLGTRSSLSVFAANKYRKAHLAAWLSSFICSVSRV